MKIGRDFRQSLAVMAIFSFGTNLLLLVIPLYLLQVYDRVLPSQSEETLLLLSMIAAATLLILAILEVARSILANRAAIRLDTGLSDQLLEETLRRSAQSDGNTQIMRDLNSLRGLLSSKLIFGPMDLPFALLFIGILYLIHPLLCLITAFSALFLGLITLANQFALSTIVHRQGKISINAAQKADQFAHGADSLFAMGMINNVVQHWGRIHATELQTADLAARINAWFAGASRFIRLGSQIAVLGVGAHLVLAGEITPGMIFAAALLAGRGLQPIDQVIGSWHQLISGWNAWKRLRGFLNAASDQTEKMTLPAPNGHLTVANVFLPNPANLSLPPLLSDVSLDLRPGEIMVVTGPSGSGKSTLAKTILGILTPKLGDIRLDGHDIFNWNRSELGKHIGYVAQDIELAPGSVAQNISRFETETDSSAVIAAARQAQAEEIVQQLPQGYDTNIGPGGTPLSGGQKQRIALARAFYGDPALLILDEPNSSLDQEGQKALFEALQHARQEGTSILFITQREVSVRAADKFVRMEGGKIISIDDRESLVKKVKTGRKAAASPGSLPASGRFVEPLRVVEKKSP